MKSKHTILLVLGEGRSGTTLTERLLADRHGLAACGEIGHLWVRSLRDDGLCSCGASFSACAFWAEAVAKSGIKGAHADAVALMTNRLDGSQTLGLLRLLADTLRPTRRRLLAALWEDLYCSVGGSADGRVVIDSTKNPFHLVLLLRLGVSSYADVAVVHVLRDVRAVAGSWQRKAAEHFADLNEQEAVMENHPVGQVFAAWMVKNWLLIAMRRVLPFGWTTITYENLMASPTSTLDGVVRDLDLRRGAQDGLQHLAAGNPSRFRPTPAVSELSEDRSARTEVPKWFRVVAAPFAKLTTVAALRRSTPLGATESQSTPNHTRSRRKISA